MLRFWGRGKPFMTAIKPTNPARARAETDSFGAIEVAGDKYWGAQAQRSLGNFKIGWEKQPKSIVRALGLVKRAAADVNMGLGRLELQDRQGHRRSRPGSERGQARRAFPPGRLADGLGHAIQHERQRGDLQPGNRDARRRTRLQDAGTPQRSRQHEPVVERHLSDGHAHRLRGGDPPPAAAGAASPPQGARRQGEGVGATSSRSGARTRRTPRR